MAYPGDITLAQEIQTRIVSTFHQALRLGDENRREEAILSCDFILRLDPQFEPARALKRRLSDDAPLELEDLQEIAAASTESVAEGELIVGDDLLSLDLGVGSDDADDSGADEDPAAHPPAPPAPGPEPTPIDLGDDAEDVFDLEMNRALSHLDPVETGAVAPGDDDAVDDNAGSDDDAWPESQAVTSDTTAGPTRAEADERIVELLQEGQAAYDNRQYQEAIDAWSRIFLIDIDHAEANRLIEKARELKAEAERELDEVLHEGIRQLEAGENQLARDAFERILALQPNHLVAKEYLEELKEGSLGLDPAVAAAGVAIETVPPPEEPAAAVGIHPEAPAEGDVEAATPDLAPAEQAAEAPHDRPPSPRRGAKKKGRRSFLLIGSAVLILALVGGWYLLGHWQGMFPNSVTDSKASGPPSTGDPFQRARDLQAAGQTALAVKLLERLAPDDSNYDEAQALIAQFQAAGETSTAPVAEEPSSETLALLRDLEGQARQAFADQRFLATDLILDRMAEIEPLSADLAARTDEVKTHLKPPRRQITPIRQGEWDTAIPQLWRLLKESRSDQDVLRLLVDGYFNLGVRDLQRGKPAAAGEKFQEALSLSPEDEEIQRLKSFSEAYENRDQDLRYQIFIKYVPFR